MSGPQPVGDRTQRRTYKTGITRDQVVDAALGLSAQHGLDGWASRQLIARLDTSFSVVFRLVGDRAALGAAVVDRVVERTVLPDADLPWRAWLTEMMTSLRSACREVPGVAGWLLMNGGTTPASLTRIRRGVAVMQRAGFGSEAMPAYAFVFTSTIGLVAMSDTRASTSPSHDHARIAAHLAAADDDLPGAELNAVQEFVNRLGTPDPDQAERALLEQFDYSLTCALDGIERRLT